MLDILSITGPIYIAIALGWLATRAGLFERADMRVLGRFVLYVALPALLFDAVSKRHVADILDWRYLLVYALSGLATMGLALLWFRRVARHAGQGPQLAVVQSMGAVCPNSGFVGYPINLLVLGGGAAGVILGMNMLVENLLWIPLLLALLDAAAGGGHWRQVLRGVAVGLLRNPLVIGLVAGLAAALLGPVGAVVFGGIGTILVVIGVSRWSPELRHLGKLAGAEAVALATHAQEAAASPEGAD